MTRVLLLVVLLVAASSCASPTANENTPSGPTQITGTVHFKTFEGGFWAVQGDDGVTYDPMNGLPSSFQHENLRVVMTVRIRPDLASTHMVGPIVEIIQLQTT